MFPPEVFISFLSTSLSGTSHFSSSSRPTIHSQDEYRQCLQALRLPTIGDGPSSSGLPECTGQHDPKPKPERKFINSTKALLDFMVTVVEDACWDSNQEVHRALMDTVLPTQA
ncbi:hypothetical protein PG996_009908 [Apiospora saccharicola]|uniref:Uncharacterized protein n=1 Tax=Apiospora saccharicola TaxID=335842 RepID=A0ABR1UM43_9PEZI